MGKTVQVGEKISLMSSKTSKESVLAEAKEGILLVRVKG